MDTEEDEEVEPRIDNPTSEIEMGKNGANIDQYPKQPKSSREEVLTDIKQSYER